jgi:hypothetical protein
VVQTPANRNFTCRLSLAGVSPAAPISVRAALRAGGRILQSSRAASPVAPMSMPALTGVSWLGYSGASSLARFVCTPPARAAGAASAFS